MSAFNYLIFLIISQYYVLICVGSSKLYRTTTVCFFVMYDFLVISGIPTASLHHVHGEREREVKCAEKENKV